MADQSSARPKWIPCYDRRVFEAQGKDHTAKWNGDIFVDGPAVTKEEFVSRVTAMAFAPPLGGPYLPASQADITDEAAAAALFDVLAGEKEKLTRHRMGKEMKSLANGEEGFDVEDVRDGNGRELNPCAEENAADGWLPNCGRIAILSNGKTMIGCERL